MKEEPKRDRRQPYSRKEGSRMQGQFYVRLYSISLSLQETGVCRNIDNIRSIEGLKDMYSLANRYNMCFLLTLLRHLLAEFHLKVLKYLLTHHLLLAPQGALIGLDF